MVKAYNKNRKAQGLPALTITVPGFTANELQRDAVRGYNGYGSARDGFGYVQHEYRVAVVGGQLGVANVNESARTGETFWVEVPIGERQHTPDPNYVQGVEDTAL